MYLCFRLSSNTVIYFVVQIIPVLAIQSPFMLAPLDRPYPVFSEPFRTFWLCSMLLIHLVCSVPQLWNRPLFKEPWFFVLENGIKTKFWVSGHSFVLRAQLLRCSLVVQQVKDLPFSLQQLGLLLWCRFNSCPGNFVMLQAQPKSKSKPKTVQLWKC